MFKKSETTEAERVTNQMLFRSTDSCLLPFPEQPGDTFQLYRKWVKIRVSHESRGYFRVSNVYCAATWNSVWTIILGKKCQNVQIKIASTKCASLTKVLLRAHIFWFRSWETSSINLCLWLWAAQFKECGVNCESATIRLSTTLR